MLEIQLLVGIFSIDIPIMAGFGKDDGLVMCTANQGCCWVFSTVKAPGYYPGTNANVGTHPVSGNRMFGFKENQNGSFSIYTKGADRARFPLASLGLLSGAIAYDEGGLLWESLIDNLNDYLSPQNSGINIIMDKNTTGERPKWDKIEEKLKSLESITVIPCD